MKLAGKVAIVTGASRGIGKAIALAYAKEGAAVVVAARTEQEERLPGTIHKTAEEIKALGQKALAIKCDVTKEEDIDATVKKTVAEFGRVDVLVNNAGVRFFSTIADTLVRRWDLIWNVNMRGPFLFCKYVIPQMIQQRSGSIINITSMAALSRRPGGIPYAATKAAIERFSLGLAEELRGGYNIAVNCLDPGRIKTEGAIFSAPKDFDWSGWTSPEVVGPPALFLAAQDGQSFTGKVVRTTEFLETWP